MRKEMTLLQAIGKVVEVAKDSQLSTKAKTKIAKEVKFLSHKFGISEMQVILFCVCMEEGPRRVGFDDIASFLNIGKIKALGFADDIDALIRRRLLLYNDAKEEDQVNIPLSVIKTIKHNEVYETPKRTELDCYGLFEVMESLFEDLSDGAISSQDLCLELMTLYEDNRQVAFARKMTDRDLGRTPFLLLSLFCHLLVNRDDDDIRFNQMEDVADSHSHFTQIKGAFRNDTHSLIVDGYIEHVCEDGIASPSRFKLTDFAKRELLAELKICVSDEKIADVIEYESLTAKQMFYTEANQHQVEELHSFLAPENYKDIRERMQKHGSRTGFACLFYGAPGTGKTETAYQLARETKRDIMVVDIPQIKSKWVGDSEKNIKALFDRYRELVGRKNSSPNGGGREGAVPILLFNEADAIIGIRKQGATSAVDKMENSIQNIILQEMEALDGILIATTNLTQNLDSAFERRFLYKICFEKPDANVRQKLWQSMLPELSDADAHSLASSYDFSGGQIENISRKAAINAILHGGATNDLPKLEEYCKAERLDNPGRKKIGF